MNKHGLPTVRSLKSCSLVKAVEVECVEGEGTAENPMRTVTTWFTTEGERIGEHDPLYATRKPR